MQSVLEMHSLTRIFQEEPLNMGAASFLQMNLKTMNYGIISRQPSAATASGYSKVHAQEQEEIVETAFSI